MGGPAIANAIVVGAAVFAASLVYASFFEWTVHRFLMHQPFLGFRHFFKGHAQVHHGIYKGDDTYLLGDRKPRELTLAWWIMPAPILLHAPLLLGLYIWLGLPAVVATTLVFVLYQGAYEYLHYCMHVPRGRWFERSRPFRWIDRHHVQHHRKHFTNLN
ncbi:MAG: fatty acid hydroxylase, partial [Chloroflexi bacterium]|nr:fatty acid hydroxylase [Chloroflexota bacterium]